MTLTPSKKQQVFNYLHERLNQWVDGTALANETVGGSEGLRRLREKRAELRSRGWVIEGRRHPAPGRTQWQYRLVRVEPVPLPDAPHVVALPEPRPYLCPKRECSHVLTGVVASEFDIKYGFGSCPRHGLQQVRL